MLKRILTFLLLSMVSISCFACNKILVIGDSLSSGYGISPKNRWVSLLNQRLIQTNPDYIVINASISGDTTSSGLSRLPDALEKHQLNILILQLGGNDGLRGLSLVSMKENLNKMIEITKSKKIKVLLVGIRIPPNYGEKYTKQFQQVFLEVANENNIALVPKLLDEIGGKSKLMQTDGVHPTEAAQKIMLENIWKELEKLLPKNAEK